MYTQMEQHRTVADWCAVTRPGGGLDFEPIYDGFVREMWPEHSRRPLPDQHIVNPQVERLARLRCYFYLSTQQWDKAEEVASWLLAYKTGQSCAFLIP